MKPLKYLIESILGKLDKDVDNAAFLNEITKYERIPLPKKGGWCGGHNTRYELDGDTLSILSASTLPWSCSDNEFWELIKSAGIKHIESNCALVFHDIDFDISGISINTRNFLYIRDCNVTIKNCNIKCSAFKVRNSKVTLDKVDIKCVDYYNNMGYATFDRSTINQKNTLINCETIHVEYDRLKGSDWGNYIESLGAVKITPSGRIKILNEKVKLNEDFVPLIPSTAKRYYIYTGVKQSRIVFETINVSYGLMFFKNGWIGRFEKG